MARMTDGEKVDHLMVLTATHTERLDNVRQELKDLKKDLETTRARLWLLVPVHLHEPVRSLAVFHTQSLATRDSVQEKPSGEIFAECSGGRRRLNT